MERFPRTHYAVRASLGGTESTDETPVFRDRVACGEPGPKTGRGTAPPARATRGPTSDVAMRVTPTRKPRRITSKKLQLTQARILISHRTRT